MYDEKVGQVCDLCSRRDYVPFLCRKCRRTLCDEHYWNKEDHPCVAQQYQGKQVLPEETKKQHRCAKCKAKVHTVNHFFCRECKQLLCLKHRLPQDHSCREDDSCQLI